MRQAAVSGGGARRQLLRPPGPRLRSLAASRNCPDSPSSDCRGAGALKTCFSRLAGSWRPPAPCCSSWPDGPGASAMWSGPTHVPRPRDASKLASRWWWGLQALPVVPTDQGRFADRAASAAGLQQRRHCPMHVGVGTWEGLQPISAFCCTLQSSRSLGKASARPHKRAPLQCGRPEPACREPGLQAPRQGLQVGSRGLAQPRKG